jgi:hypothetical protein
MLRRFYRGAESGILTVDTVSAGPTRLMRETPPDNPIIAPVRSQRGATVPSVGALVSDATCLERLDWLLTRRKPCGIDPC